MVVNFQARPQPVRKSILNSVANSNKTIIHELKKIGLTMF